MLEVESGSNLMRPCIPCKVVCNGCNLVLNLVVIGEEFVSKTHIRLKSLRNIRGGCCSSEVNSVRNSGGCGCSIALHNINEREL